MRGGLFLHGGPGFSSRPEEILLRPALLKEGINTKFWNEPSVHRPKGFPYNSASAFLNQIESIRSCVKENGQPSVCICHSYAIFPILMAVDKGYISPERLVFISPVFNLHEAHKRILRLASSDLRPSDEKLANRLDAIASSDAKFFDEQMREGLSVAAADPNLLNHYWVNKTIMGQVFQLLSEPGYQFDPDSFMSVLLELRAYIEDIITKKNRSISVLCVYGANDPVAVRQKDEGLAKNLFMKMKTIEMRGGHWVHLESMNQFIRAVIDWME